MYRKRITEFRRFLPSRPRVKDPTPTMATTARVVRLLLVLIVATVSLHTAFALRSLGVREGAGGADGDAAVDLNATNFDAFLKASPESFAVVEFFAHWCPACRKYKPHYEKVAKLFNGQYAAHPGIIVMTRVDCASKVNMDLCTRFSVDHYPFLLWGRSKIFASAQWKPKQENSEIEVIDDGRTSERLLKWINKKTGSSFSLEDKNYEHEKLLQMTSFLKKLLHQLWLPTQMNWRFLSPKSATATHMVTSAPMKQVNRRPAMKKNTPRNANKS